MSETELAQKLGISRKSLWERRQRLGIPRRKAPAIRSQAPMTTPIEPSRRPSQMTHIVLPDYTASLQRYPENVTAHRHP
jgi:hypothetical protein